MKDLAVNNDRALLRAICLHEFFTRTASAAAGHPAAYRQIIAALPGRHGNAMSFSNADSMPSGWGEKEGITRFAT